MIVAGSLLTFGVCAFAFHRGGEAERVVAAGAMAVLLASLGAQMLLGRGVAWPVLGADLLLSVAVGVVTAIHLRPWLYVESALSVALLLVHGVMLGLEGPVVTPLYAALVDSLTLAMLGVLLAATLGRRTAGARGALNGLVSGGSPREED